MRPFFLVGVATTLVAGSPAPQAIDFNAVKAAPAPSVTGPVVGVSEQTDVYNPAAASNSAVAAVTGTAAASATASQVAARDLDERGKTSKSATSTVTSYPTSTTSPVVNSPTTTPPATTGVVVPSTCTPVSWTNTFAFTSDTACPTPYEVGTYCGFINPEDPCAPQPDGYGPVPTPDTVAGFYASSALSTKALTAKAPGGYAATFKNLNGSVNANTYLGFHTLKSYDVQGCADYCDETDLCTSFNIYMERDPAWNPEQCSCDDPPSITNYKCSLWGSGVESAAATNYGQSRGKFQTVITGSDGYTKTNNTVPDTPPHWTPPKKCGGIHDHPSTCIGQTIFKGPFDASLCAIYADKQNAKNAASGLFGFLLKLLGYNRGKCNFFNAFMLKRDGVPVGTYCKLFAQQYEPAKATYQGGVSSGATWGYESSYSFSSK